MAKGKDTALKTATVLAFERKISPSDAKMYSGQWENSNLEAKNKWHPIMVTEKAIRGTVSNRLKTKENADPLKLDADITNANLQTIDIASLPLEHDTLRVDFSVRILPEIPVPNVCNNQEYQTILESKINGYIAKNDLMDLSIRYATNLANGRFLWRNLLGAAQVKVIIFLEDNDNEQWEFNALELTRQNNFDHNNSDIQEIASAIRDGFLDKRNTLFKVYAYSQLGGGQEVFPSQELVLDQDSKAKGSKSKVLYHLNQIGLHNQSLAKNRVCKIILVKLCWHALKNFKSIVFMVYQGN